MLLILGHNFFFLKDGHRFIPWATHVVGPLSGAHVAEMLRRSLAGAGQIHPGAGIVGPADGGLIGIGLLVVAVPAAVPLAILTFLGGFVPIIGVVVVGTIAVLVVLVSNGFVGALIVLVIILAVEQTEGDILQPVLRERRCSFTQR